MYSNGNSSNSNGNSSPNRRMRTIVCENEVYVFMCFRMANVVLTAE